MLRGVVAELVSGARALATDLRSAAAARPDTGNDPTRASALAAARLLDEAADASEAVRGLMANAVEALDGPPLNGVAYPDHSGQGRYGAQKPYGAQNSSRGEANMSPETSIEERGEAAELGPRDSAQAAVAARQVEAARQHLRAALTVGQDVGDQPWRTRVLAIVDNMLRAVGELAGVAKEALAPDVVDRVFPDESRFLCVLPWERVALASDRATPASVNTTTMLLAALGYDARTARDDQGPPRVEIRGTRYTARVLLRQLRLSGSGEWMAYIDWADGDGQQRSNVETLGPAEVSDEELSRRVDDALRRRVSVSAP